MEGQKGFRGCSARQRQFRKPEAKQNEGSMNETETNNNMAASIIVIGPAMEWRMCIWEAVLHRKPSVQDRFLHK